MRFSLRSLFPFAVLSTSVLAAVTPFVTQGRLDSAVANGQEYNAGGTIFVNGYNITIPKNLVFQFSAAWVPFREIAVGSFIGNEVNVAGNIVDGRAIAAQIQISQNLANLGTGYIESINIADGSMKIVGGPTLRINDPNAVFSKGYTAMPFFTADDENPSISAFSGFPMCIPRSETDSECPQSNRPAGQRIFEAPNRKKMAPFQVGDYLEFAGFHLGDEVLCYSIVAINVQITTPSGPGTFIRIEDALVAVYDPSADVELAETRFIGFVSTPNEGVTISAVDVDPCTGAETERIIGSAFPRSNADDPRNRFELRADTNTASKYTREYRIRAIGGTAAMDNGIIAGQYLQPVTEWIYPEVATPGTDLPPVDFTLFNHLALGWNDGERSFGQLSPWPGAVAPSGAPNCTVVIPTPTGAVGLPTAEAGAAITARPGVIIQLSGSNNNTNISDSQLEYSWKQISGSTVTLSGSDSPRPSFTAPAQLSTEPTVVREFELIISYKTPNSTVTSNDTVSVTTKTDIIDVVTIDSYTWTSRQSGTISVTAHSNVVLAGQGQATLSLSIDTTLVAMQSIGNGVFTYSARSVKQPAQVTVTSSLGGSASLTQTTTKKKRFVKEI